MSEIVGSGEPREHHLGEVLQGRSKSNFYNILFDSSVFISSGLHNPNNLEITPWLQCSKISELDTS